MYVSHLFLVITPWQNIVSEYQIKKKYGLDITCHLEVKVQGRIWIMNVRDTLSYGDTPICQIW